MEALEGDPEAFSASAEEYRALSLNEIKSRLGFGSADSFVVGAFEAGRMMGMAGFYRDKGLKSRHKGRVWGVYVTPSKRGTGLGRRMLETLLDRGRGIHGVEQILLSVTATQTAAIALYRSLGFEFFGREPRALRIGDRHIDEEYFVLSLKPAD